MRALFLLFVVLLTGGAILVAIPSVEKLLAEAPATEPSSTEPEAARVEEPKVDAPEPERLAAEEPATPEELSEEAEKAEAPADDTTLSVEEIFKAPDRDENLFPIPANLGPAVAFWTRIYSDVDTRGGLIHDNLHMDVVYSMLDLNFEPMPEPVIERNLSYFRNLLWGLAKGKREDLNCDEQRLLAIWGGEPSALKAAAERIRFQRGQSDRFLHGLNRSAAWRSHILETLEEQKLPRELAALPHVESSFHPRVVSHAGAAGLWQFMPATGRRYMRVDELMDERFDPFKASEAAAQLLKHNHSVLRSWPLALTAYNHGLSGVYSLTKRFSTKDIGEIVGRSNGNRGLGFASRNFYTSFLAALEVSDHPRRYFPALHPRPPAEPSGLELNAFMPADSLAKSLGLEQEVLQKHNPVLQISVWSGSKYIPKGYRVVLPPEYDLAGSAEKLRLAEQESGSSEQKPDISHKVKAGDTLSTIAGKYGISTAELIAMNTLGKNNRIRVGQSLRLPGGKQPAPDALPQGQETAGGTPEKAPPVMADIKPEDAVILAANKAASPAGEKRPAQAHPAAESAKAEPEKPNPADLNELANKQETASEPSPNNPEIADKDRPAEEEPEKAAPADLNPLTGKQEAVAESAPNNPEVAKEQPKPEAESKPKLATGEEKAANEEPEAKEEEPQQTADPSDYRVADDGTIEVQAAETLGHYSAWLDILADRLKKANGRRFTLAIGHRMRLVFAKVNKKSFEQKRRAYHDAMQSSFFNRYRIAATREHRISNGDSLWWLAIRRYDLPLWLLRQYNPDLEIESALPRGTVVKIPVVEKISGKPGPKQSKTERKPEQVVQAKKPGKYDLKVSAFRPVPGRSSKDKSQRSAARP